MNVPELLAPAGGMPALRAAVDHGADAVYLGYASFGARASAANFDDESLPQAIRYAHLYHCRVYVTVNTLIKPEEIPTVQRALCLIRDAGADAVIVQDLGVAQSVLELCPGLPLHASTQMAICNASGALFAQKRGFRRVVLARECSLEEIRRVCATGMETEVFVHGALCTAVSGRCLMSSMAGGRSGNRGRCAQPCRQEFCLGRDRGALLSQRDLCLLNELPALAEAGVCSLKIEGRLKSPEYVAVVTKEYRKALDALAEGHFPADSAQSMEQLRQIFNRGSFTRGHAFGSEDAELVTGTHVSHEGVPLGKVTALRGNLAVISLSRALNNDDSLQIHSRQDVDLRYAGPDRNKGETASVYLRNPGSVRVGDAVSRLASAKQLEAVRSAQPKEILIEGKASFRLGEPSRFTLTDGKTSITTESFCPQAAQKHASSEENVRKQLSRFGETPFTLKPGGLQIEMDDGLFLPVGELNTLRRKACALLEEARIAAFERPPAGKVQALKPYPKLPEKELHWAVLSPLLSLQRELPPEAFFVYTPEVFLPEQLEKSLSELEKPLWLRLPPQLTEGCLQDTLGVIRRHLPRLSGLWLESVSQLDLALPLPVIAGEGIPLTNPLALRLTEDAGLSAFCLWPEWTEKEQFPHPKLPAFLKVYGRQTVMLLNHCPARALRGLSNQRKGCRICREGCTACGLENPALLDRKGYRFPLKRTLFPEGCEISVLGALPTDLSACRDGWLAQGLKPMLHFTVETEKEQTEIVRYFEALLQGENVKSPIGESTWGHWLHGVE